MEGAAVLGVSAVLLAVWLKGLRPEIAVCLSLGATVLLLGMALHRLSDLLQLFRRLESMINWEEGYLTVLLRIMGVTYLSEFASAICKDAGYQSIAGQIDLIGKLTVLSVSMPVILALLETLDGFLFS